MGNCLKGDTARLIAFRGLRAADFSRISVVVAPLVGEAFYA
ncbi:MULTISPECIES: hypothetical protein [Novosphingobium]|nr:hypothetical protein [Novosphingobium resinovorum]